MSTTIAPRCKPIAASFSNLSDAFLIIAASMLTITATAKLISACQSVRALNVADPLVFFLPQRGMFLLTGLLEGGVAAYLLVSKNRIVHLWLVAWLATLFLLYRVGLALIGYHGPCGCLGNVSGWLRLNDSTIDALLKCVLAYLGLGSLSLLACHAAVSRRFA